MRPIIQHFALIFTLTVSAAEAGGQLTQFNLAGSWSCTAAASGKGRELVDILNVTPFRRTSKAVGPQTLQKLGAKRATTLFTGQKNGSEIFLFLIEHTDSIEEFIGTPYGVVIWTPYRNFTVHVQDSGIGRRSITFKRDPGRSPSDFTCTKSEKSPPILL